MGGVPAWPGWQRLAWAGCVAAYYPETNALVLLSAVATNAGTLTSKCIPVLVLLIDLPDDKRPATATPGVACRIPFASQRKPGEQPSRARFERHPQRHA